MNTVIKRRAWLLTFILLIGMFCAFGTAAAVEPDSAAVLSILAPNVFPKAGEKFDITVDISGNPGLCAIQFELLYDKNAMTCTDISTGKVLSGMLCVTGPNSSGDAIVAAASVEEVTQNGTMAIFSFTAKKNITVWSISLSGVNLSDGSGKGADYTVKSNSGHTAAQQTGGELPSSGTSVGFPDMTGHWGAEYAQKAAVMGLFTGFPDGTFRPDATISRAEFVTTLWRAAGSPEPKSAAPFTDVPANVYYTKAVAWANENGYVNGTSSTTFNPSGVLQRQAAMKILYYYNGGTSGLELMLSSTYDTAFADSKEIASWAKAPMYWAYYNGIISGVGNNRLAPQAAATRVQIAKMLVNYLEKNNNSGGMS